MIFKPKQKAWVEAAAAAGFSAGAILTYDEIDGVCVSMGFERGKGRPWWLINDTSFRAGRGEFRIPTEGAVAVTPLMAGKALGASATGPVVDLTPAAVVENIAAVPEPTFDAAPVPTANVTTLKKASAVTESMIPAKFANYVPFGHFSDVSDIIKSKMFYPLWISGLSGNGKTLMVEQACSRAGRECFTIPITVETDEEDLLGGFRLIDGNTVWFDGPVTEAAKRGAVCLLDELDLGTSKLMCLQGILDGKDFLLKKINEVVKPAHGFQIIATANTKGKGDETGMFIGANVINEAFLERFPVTMDQDYPSKAVELKIVKKELHTAGRPDDDFAEKLTGWSTKVRKAYEEDAIDSIITTRRLAHIAKAYGITADRMKAINWCLNRFEDETKAALLEFYSMIDDKVDVPDERDEEEVAAPHDEDSGLVPF